jgi:hypothetical protein
MSFESTVRKNLLDIVAAYQAATGKSLSDISREFYGKGDFFAKYLLNKDKYRLSVRSVDRMIRKFRRRWPKKADWPFVRGIFMTREHAEHRG